MIYDLKVASMLCIFIWSEGEGEQNRKNYGKTIIVGKILLTSTRLI